MAKGREAGGLRRAEVAAGLAAAGPVPLPGGLGMTPNDARGAAFGTANRGVAQRGTTAMASISTRKCGFANPATKAAVIAGGFGVSTHAR